MNLFGAWARTEDNNSHNKTDKSVAWYANRRKFQPNSCTQTQSELLVRCIGRCVVVLVLLVFHPNLSTCQYCVDWHANQIVCLFVARMIFWVCFSLTIGNNWFIFVRTQIHLRYYTDILVDTLCESLPQDIDIRRKKMSATLIFLLNFKAESKKFHIIRPQEAVRKKKLELTTKNGWRNIIEIHRKFFYPAGLLLLFWATIIDTLAHQQIHKHRSK